MKHIILLTLLSLSSIFAQLPSKVEDLKAKRDKAIENINAIYKQELQKLLNDPSVKNDPQKLMEVVSEIQQSSQSDISVAEDALRLHNKKIKTHLGSVFVFKKDSSGIKISTGEETPISWRYLDNTTIEVIGRDSKTAPPKTWYFKFLDGLKDIRYGLSLDSVEWMAKLEN